MTHIAFQWEDDAAVSKYDRFDEPDPHADDYPMDTDDMPPAYDSPADSAKVIRKGLSRKNRLYFFQIEDIDPKVDDIP